MRIDRVVNARARIRCGDTIPEPLGLPIVTLRRVDNGSYNGSNPQSLNRYAYVGGSPFSAVDPSGLDASGWFYAGVTNNTELYGSTIGSWLNSLAPFVPFLDAADLAYNVFGVFDDFGKAFGWWGGSPFHGNSAASQSGKNVPSISSLALLQFSPAEPDVEPSGEGGNEPEDWEGPPETWPLSPVEPGEFVGRYPGTFLPGENGPLPASERPNFDWYVPVTLEEPETYYRTWGGNSPLRSRGPGTYYSFFAPVGSNAWMRQQFSLLPEWGNTMEKMNEVEIPAGTTVFIGPASAKEGVDGNYSGGGIQVWVPNP